MQIVTWPNGVPDCAAPLSAQGGPMDNRVVFTSEDERDITRPRNSWTPDLYSIDLAPMSQTQFATFETWFKTTLAFGANAFILDHPITGTPSAWRIVKADSYPYQVRKVALMPKAGDRGLVVSLQIKQEYWVAP